MNMLASGFENFINGIFANWQMLLFVLAAVFLLMAIAFRKFRTAVLIFVIVAGGIGIALLVDLIVKAIHWDLPDLVTFLVKWVPTVLFTVTVLVSTLVGLKRGLRKSLILLAHEVAIAAVCIIIYAVLIKLPAVDGFVLKLVDAFMGGDGSLASTLGVKKDCDGIKEVFVEWLPTVIGDKDFTIMLGASKAYIYTLADLIYRVAFAILMYIVFLILDFIMYIVYLCCYSERKYREKIKQKYVENKVDRRYSKHHTGGGVVGLIRGVAIGLLSLSFLGTALYIVAGRGDGKMKDYDLGNDNVNEYYSVYRSIESYGTYGIFKVLNSISSTDDVPYYLFAADLVFSGELDDEDLGVSGNIVFREELSAYTDFARDTMELLLKYGGDEIRELVNGEATKSAFDTVINVISKEGFRVEFNDLISEFDAKTYVINFAMSFVNSAIANIDDISFTKKLSDENKELLKILFTKGYLSDYIPDEYVLKQMVDGSTVQIVQPHINVSKLVNKKDIQIIFNLFMDLLGEKINTRNDVLRVVADVLPQIKKISLLNENRAEELDPVLGRLYCYAANRYLTEEGSEGVCYTDIFRENIEWVSEINALMDVTEASVNLYNNIASDKQPLEAVIAVFDKSNPDYEENIKYYDDITKSVLSSRIIGKTLSTSRIYRLIESALSNLFEGIYVPRDLVYETTYNVKGEVVQAGEMYNVLNGLAAIGKNSDLLSILDGFDKDRDMETFLTSLAETVTTEDENGNTLADYLVRSKILRSVISASLINYGEEYAYVPTVAREKNADGLPVNFIKAEELTALFDCLSDLVDFILPVLQDENADMKTAIADFVERDVFKTLLNSSRIFEGTVALHLVNELGGDETVVISQSLKDNLDGWVTANGKDGELKNLLGALDAAQIKIADIVNGTFEADSILDKFTSEEFTAESLQTCLKSSVLHYTVSKFLTGEDTDFGSFKLIVPEAAQQKLEDDVLSAVVRKSEIENVLRVVKEFGLSEETDVSAVLTKLAQSENKKMLSESYILSASVVCSLVENSDVNEMLELPVRFKEAATTERLKKFNSSNPWKTEIIRLIDALDEIMGISSSDGGFVFDSEKLTDSLSAFLKDMNESSTVNANVSKLTVCYASEVVRGSITSRLDELLHDNIDEGILLGAKSNDGYYTEKELRSLSSVLKIFEIDVMNIDADTLTKKIKAEILNLNGPAPAGYSGTKLDVVYPSVIFSGVMSKALNDVLLNGEDEEGNPAPLIEEKILYEIKGGVQRYRQELIAQLITSINALGIENFEDLNNLDVNTAIDNVKDMDAVCESVIIRGVFTKQIKDNNTLGVDHPLAYEEGIIKAAEIKAIVNLVGKLNDVEDTYFDTVPLAEIRENMFYGDRSVKSYLILSAVSDSIKKDNANLIVDRALIDTYGCVDSQEVWSLCEAFIKMFDENASVSTLGKTGFSYPDKEQRQVALDSKIVRAKLTEQIIGQNAGNIFVSDKNFKKFTDTKGRTHGIISAVEMNAVFNVIDECGGSDFKVPDINYQTLKQYNRDNRIDLMFGSDIIRYKICDYVIAALNLDISGLKQERAFEITELQTVTKYVMDAEEVKAKISSFS